MGNNNYKGGKARMASLTPEQRRENARKARAARQDDLAEVICKRDVLRLGGLQLPCAVVKEKNSNEPVRVVAEHGIVAVVYGSASAVSGTAKRLRKKELQDGQAETPLFLADLALKPFISIHNLEQAAAKRIAWRDGSRVVYGYDVRILTAACRVWCDAADAGVLTASQTKKALRAKAVLAAVADVGIIAMIDEATGYQAVRPQTALAEIFEAFITEKIRPWVKRFPDKFYLELSRLTNTPLPQFHLGRKPWSFIDYTNDIVYARLAPHLLEELDNAGKKLGKTKYTKKHQLLSDDVGHPKLQEHFRVVIAIMALSETEQDFFQKLDIVLPKFIDPPAVDTSLLPTI